MNYFGHAALAAMKEREPRFVLGAMLPDIVAMAGARGQAFSADRVSEGGQFHLQTDAVFHQTRVFVENNRRVLKSLRDQGVSRGPARAAAHIGVEMLIDWQLVQDDVLFNCYRLALQEGAEHPELFTPLTRDKAMALANLCTHLHERGRAVFVPSAERFHYRLGHALSGRRLITPTEDELLTIADTLSADCVVQAQVSALLEELAPLLK